MRQVAQSERGYQRGNGGELLQQGGTWHDNTMDNINQEQHNGEKCDLDLK